MEHIGENIKRIRKEKKMTIADLTSEHISAGMISLIENNKTKPSVERLQHIANNLGVPIQDLLAKYSREELRDKIEAFEEKIQTHDGEKIKEALEEMNELLPYLGDQYEATKIHELIAHYTYYLFLFYADKYNRLSNHNWEKHANTAIQLYKNLQMEWRTLNMKAFLANAEVLKANYGKAIQIIDEAIEESYIDDNKESQAAFINLLYLKSGALDSLGEREKAHEVIDEAIAYMKTNLIMNRFFELHNMKALFLYDEYEFERAREVAKTAQKFVELTENQMLHIEMMYNHIHYNEFYEENIERAYQLIEETKKLQSVLKKEGVPEDILENSTIFLKDARARCLTREGKYEEAIPLFEQYEFIIQDHITMTPLDLSLRTISKSYLARCYFHLGQRDQARKLAKEVVHTLSRFSHTSYFMFAREVLKEVSV